MASVQVIDFTDCALGVIRLERDDVSVEYVMKLDECIKQAFRTNCRFRDGIWRINVLYHKNLKTILSNGGYEEGICHYDGE